MWQSPIEMYFNDMRISQEERLEETVFKAVQEVGIQVNRDELLKALAYDREQYDKGYRDACRDMRRAFFNALDELRTKVDDVVTGAYNSAFKEELR